MKQFMYVRRITHFDNGSSRHLLRQKDLTLTQIPP